MLNTIQKYKFKAAFADNTKNVYDILCNNDETIFTIVRSQDISESSSVYTIREKYKQLSCIIQSGQNIYIVKDNLLHCEDGPACIEASFNWLLCKELEGYFLYGVRFSFKTWLSWVKETKHWPNIMNKYLSKKE